MSKVRIDEGGERKVRIEIGEGESKVRIDEGAGERWC